MLRIRNWEQYEVGRARERLGPMDWVAVSTDLNSLGWCKLVTEYERGLQYYTVWIALLAVAASFPKGRRGVLASLGGRPYTVSDISLKTRIKEEMISEAIPVLIELGWLEDVNPGTSLPCVIEQKPSGSTEPPGDDLWEEFKRLYPPHRLNEQFACQMFISHEDRADIIAGLRRAVVSQDWTKENGSYVPWASNFISEGKYSGFKTPEKPKTKYFDPKSIARDLE